VGGGQQGLGEGGGCRVKHLLLVECSLYTWMECRRRRQGEAADA
jgi:hypothetical protein